MWIRYTRDLSHRNRNTPKSLGVRVYQIWRCGLLMGMDARERTLWSEATAAQIRAERAAAGLTQIELAERAGMPRITYVRLEKGSRVADVSQLEKLCRAFDLPMSEFFRRVEERVDAEFRRLTERPD
jgi:DNA-binding XRE family transcriptional regulator